MQVQPVYAAAAGRPLNGCVYLALDVSVLKGSLCADSGLVIYRGRAIPLAWRPAARQGPRLR